MAKTIMGEVVPLDGYIADDDDDVGPLFDWYGNGDVAWSLAGSDDQLQTTQVSADFMQAVYADIAAVVIGRRLFDLTNGWSGTPAAGEHVFVVTHRPPAEGEHADSAPFTFVGGVKAAIAAAPRVRRKPDRRCRRRTGRASAAARSHRPGRRLPRSGRVWFGTPILRDGLVRAGPMTLDDPWQVVPGDRVVHLVYDVKPAAAAVTSKEKD